jgi:hypothetical protein
MSYTALLCYIRAFSSFHSFFETEISSERLWHSAGIGSCRSPLLPLRQITSSTTHTSTVVSYLRSLDLIARYLVSFRSQAGTVRQLL